MTEINQLINKYYKNDGLNNTGSNRRVKGEMTSKEYYNNERQEASKQNKHLILDQLLNEIPFRLNQKQVQQIRRWIDLFNNDWKEFHRQASNETIILALIFIQYKQANKGIKLEKYTITEKYKLTPAIFETIQNELIFQLMKTTELRYSQNKYYDHEKEKNKDQYEELDMDKEFVNENYAKLNKKTDQGVDIIEASGLESALQEISLEEYDKHPEKRMRQAWNNFFEKQLPIYKEQYPNLKRQQYINMIQKEFKTSPDNPVYMKKIKDSQKQEEKEEKEEQEDEK